jgi:hypothetical protein
VVKPHAESFSKQSKIVFAGNATCIIAGIVSNMLWAIDLFLKKGIWVLQADKLQIPRIQNMKICK